MIIKCPQCSATYDQPASTLGKKVRCTRCQSVWRAEAPAPDVAEPPAAAEEARPPVHHASIGSDSRPATAETRPAPKTDIAPPRPVAVEAPAPMPQAVNGTGHGHGDTDDDESGDDESGDEAEAPAPVIPPPMAASSVSPAPRKDPFAVRPGTTRTSDLPPRVETARASQAQPAAKRAALPQPAFDDFGDDAEAAPSRDHRHRAGTPTGANGTGRHKTAPAPAPDAFWDDDDSTPVLPPTKGAKSSRQRDRAPAPAEADAYDDPYTPASLDDARDGSRTAGRGLLVLGWLALVSLVAGLGAFLYVGRTEVVRALPGIAPVYARAGMPINVRGLEFRDVSFQWTVDAKGRPAMDIAGEVENVSDQPRSVPTVVFAFQDAEGLEIFNWATPIRYTALQPGKRTRFQARIPAPPASVANLQVRFARARGGG